MWHQRRNMDNISGRSRTQVYRGPKSKKNTDIGISYIYIYINIYKKTLFFQINSVMLLMDHMTHFHMKQSDFENNTLKLKTFT